MHRQTSSSHTLNPVKFIEVEHVYKGPGKLLKFDNQINVKSVEM